MFQAWIFPRYILETSTLLNRAIEVYKKCVDMGLGDSHDVAVLVDVVKSMPREKN